jgi:hypothetical protein
MRFSSVIGDYNYREKMSSMFISIFCYRRLVEVVLIVFLPSYPYAQVQLMTLSSVLVVIMFGYSNVYLMFRNRILEFFNEAIILFCCYHTFCFTDFVDDPIMRYNVGFSLIVLTSINVGVNIIVMMHETLKKLFRIYKVLRQKYRKWKILYKIKQIQKKK